MDQCNGSQVPSVCKEGCICQPGYVLSGQECVPRSQCGCTDDYGSTFPVSGDRKQGWGHLKVDIFSFPELSAWGTHVSRAGPRVCGLVTGLGAVQPGLGWGVRSLGFGTEESKQLGWGVVSQKKCGLVLNPVGTTHQSGDL